MANETELEFLIKDELNTELIIKSEEDPLKIETQISGEEVINPVKKSPNSNNTTYQISNTFYSCGDSKSQDKQYKCTICEKSFARRDYLKTHCIIHNTNQDELSKCGKKHYTDVEKHLFLNILKRFKDTIENKKSDSATLREKESKWTEIWEEYNSSSIVHTQRTIKQLKKWWSNLKREHRDALTCEKQAPMATGGGPPFISVDADADIANIVPHLMENASVLFSSNFSREENQKRRATVLNDESLDEFLIEQTEFQECLANQSFDLTTKSDTTDNYDIPKKKPKWNNKKENTEEQELKLQRIKNIMQHEEELAKAKLLHEKLKQKMEMEHLAQKNLLEIRAATASATLAELLLKQQEEIKQKSSK